MPYNPPADTTTTTTRNHHRSRSFTQEKGPGAFAPLSHVPRRAKAPPTFHLKGSSSESDDDDEELNESKSDAIPFPTIPSPAFNLPSPAISKSMSTPQLTPSHPSPSIYRSPYTSGKSSPTTPRKPLKPSLKSNHSSPHLPSLAGPRTFTQSAPTTPHLLPPLSGSSTPNSADDDPYSVYASQPQTPKQVHFAEKSSLESVVVFNKTARPRSLSTGGNDTETETEGYDSSSNAWNPNRYPFPVMPKQDEQPHVVLDDTLTTQIPPQFAIASGGYIPGSSEKHYVYLESLALPNLKPPVLKGAVLVRNVAFQKHVALRFTMDDWQTISEVTCNYAASLPSLPPPFASTTGASTPTTTPASGGGESYANGPLGQHNRSASLNSIMSAVPPTGRVDSWDRFTFTIKLEDFERTLVTKKLQLAVRYTVPSQWGWECGGEWWDNNAGSNYVASFKHATKSTSAEAEVPATMRAARAKHQEEVRRQTSSLPPLPPPGPIRPMSAPGLHSLRAKVDKEGLLPPPVLRQHRIATFKDTAKREVESPPPGSPTKRVFPKGTGSPTVSPVNSAVWSSGGMLGNAPTSMYQNPAPEPSTVPESKPPALTISTTVAPTPVTPTTVSPTLSTGKAKRLSLSNYASPVSKPISEHPRTSSDSSIPTPSSPADSFGLKVVGGMPATMVFNATIDVDPSKFVPRRTFPANGRVASWDGIWGAAGKNGARKVFDSKPDLALVFPSTDPLPTPPDSSSSATSTPDLERSPEAIATQVPLPPDGEESNPSDNDTVTGKDSIPFPQGSPERPALSNLARRTSMGNVRLDLPKRPTFDLYQDEEEAPVPLPEPKTMSSPRGSDSGASSASTATPVPLPTTTLSPSNSSSSLSTLSLDENSPSTNGPPAEFLAKYCFFVSSPSTSPPVPQAPRSTAKPNRQPGINSPSGEIPRSGSPSAPPSWWSGTFASPLLGKQH